MFTRQQNRVRGILAALAPAAATLVTVATAIACGGPSEPKQPVGSTLHKKEALAVDDIPAEVVETVKAERPGVKITGAEKEWKYGKTYIDVEALDESGEEIEFDLLKTGDGWKIAEVQRDLEYADLPAEVREQFERRVPDTPPARIIESDQGGGVIIFELFEIAQDGSERKHEVKWDNGQAELLDEEWEH